MNATYEISNGGAAHKVRKFYIVTKMSARNSNSYELGARPKHQKDNEVYSIIHHHSQFTQRKSGVILLFHHAQFQIAQFMNSTWGMAM